MGRSWPETSCNIPVSVYLLHFPLADGVVEAKMHRQILPPIRKMEWNEMGLKILHDLQDVQVWD